MRNDHSQTMGLDLGDKRSHFCVLDSEGQVCHEGTVPTNPTAFRKFFLSVAFSLVVLEVGTHSRWVSELLVSAGRRILVANAGKVALIHQSNRKNDRLDARHLARPARIDPDLLSPITHREEKAQAGLSVIRARDVLVRSRTALINCVRGLAKPTGLRLPSCASAYLPGKVAPLIPPSLLPAIAPLLEQIDSVSNAILEHDEQIAHMAQTERPETALLQQIAGVGSLTALSGLVQRLGMVNRTDELSLLPVLSDKETLHQHRSGVLAILLRLLSANLQ